MNMSLLFWSILVLSDLLKLSMFYHYRKTPVEMFRTIEPIKKKGINILVFIGEDFDDIELTMVLSILKKAKINTVFAGLTKALNFVTCEYKVRILPDADIELVMMMKPYHMIILPGGKGYHHYLKCPEFVELILAQNVDGHFIGSMSSGAFVLQSLNISYGKHIAAQPNFKDILSKDYTVDDVARVVHDGHLITSQGPCTAIEFSIYIVEIFKGKKVADEVAELIGYERNSTHFIKILNPDKPKNC